MAVIDIRGEDGSPVDKIIFGNDHCILKYDGVIEISDLDNSEYFNVNISDIDNLIKALQKAKELKWDEPKRLSLNLKEQS